jgi:pyruvate/2-oxoglutarate dehydrogenase complex dihydrolipoamide dehydrogenase (E3) component
MSNHFDLIAIGAGSGGLSAADRAAEYGMHLR